MSDARRALGAAGEDFAAAHLAQQGYQILARNIRCAGVELDIVARRGRTLVFVEVKTRRGREFGTPEEAVTPAKQAKLVELAATYV